MVQTLNFNSLKTPAENQFNKACQHHRQGQIAEAIGCYLQAIHLNPEYWDAYQNLGAALCANSQYETAVAYFKKVQKLRPENTDGWNNLAQALHHLGQYEEAEACFEKALALKPNDPLILCNHGFHLIRQGLLDEALVCFRRVLMQHTKNIEALKGVSLALLLQGNLRRGLSEFYELQKMSNSPWPGYSQPIWRGENLPDKTLLIHEGEPTHSGLGDTVQFCRYVPWVVPQFKHVILECRRPLTRLLTSVDPNITVVTRGDPPPPFDVRVQVDDLAVWHGTELETIPNTSPYLKISREWLSEVRLPQTSSFKVGISWAGQPGRDQDRRRSCPFHHLLPLLSLPNIRFYSLQKGEATDAIAKHYSQGLIDSLDGRHVDFAATAAVMAQLDLIISVDTSVAHVAGALGKPVWVMLPYDPDWRWLLDRNDSPWYPTMRLFRAPQPYAWDALIQAVIQALLCHTRQV